MKRRLNFFLTAILVSAFLGGAGYSAASDSLTLNYRMRDAEGENGGDSGGRRLFSFTEFTTTIENRGGRIVFERMDKTPEGDRYDWTLELGEDDLEVISVRKKITARNGQVIEDSREYYSRHFIDIPGNAFHVQMLSLLGRKVDFTKVGEQAEYKVMFSPEFKPLTVFLTVEGEETVTVPAGEFDCYKVRMEYSKDDLPGIFKVIPTFLLKTLVSDYYLWFEKAEPHNMVRFQGKLEGFSGPEKVQELMSVEGPASGSSSPGVK